MEKITVNNDVNILGSSHYTTRSCTVLADGILANAKGRKIVAKGSILNADGKIVNDATATGVLFDDVDVTNGNEVGAIIEHGIVLEKRLPVAPSVEAKTALKQIIFR